MSFRLRFAKRLQIDILSVYRFSTRQEAEDYKVKIFGTVNGADIIESQEPTNASLINGKLEYFKTKEDL